MTGFSVRAFLPPCSEFRRNIGVALFAVWSVTSALHAAAPTLDALHPTGARPGEKTTVAIIGKSDPWPVSAWCSHPAVRITTDKEKKGELIFDIPAATKPGPVLVRLFNAEGASELHTFVIGSKTVAELSEIEPNSSLSDPKSLDPESKKPTPLPVVINGKLSESGDVDLFPISLKKGQTIRAAVVGYSLASPIDPHMILYGPPPERAVVALANDGPNTLDPRLEHTVDRHGDYLLGVMAFVHPPSSTISFTSKASAVYRLTMSTGPWLKHVEPNAVAAIKPTKLKIHGSDKPIEVTIPAADPRTESGFDAEARYPMRAISHPTLANTLSVPVTDFPIQTGETITIPAAVSGTLAKDNESDIAKFSAGKGDRIQFRLGAHYLSSDLDPVLMVENNEGKELKRADDTKPTVDAELLWTSPADGDYVVRIADVTGSGSANHRYLLTAEIAAPQFSATASASRFDLKPGDKTELTVKLTRSSDHKLPLDAHFENLPAGVKTEVGDIPEKTGDVKIHPGCRGKRQASQQAVPDHFHRKARRRCQATQQAGSFFNLRRCRMARPLSGRNNSRPLAYRPGQARGEERGRGRGKEVSWKQKVAASISEWISGRASLSPTHASTSLTTRPCTSVSRKSRPA